MYIHFYKLPFNISLNVAAKFSFGRELLVLKLHATWEDRGYLQPGPNQGMLFNFSERRMLLRVAEARDAVLEIWI